nr:peptide chain release factor 3 [bacterium]
MAMAQNDWAQEIGRRRTFAIIAHPDAGKTTLTEKLLLYGGAIHMAGAVKARKAARHAVSDWMEIEKQRGISVTSSVMAFDYAGCRINILDTPGHQDFSEDTYRTLVAADAAVMLIDGAHGVEEQTIKLFHVCRMQGIPVFTFVNKMDRASKPPLELMEEIESVLGIRTYPVNWPIGTDGDLQGIYHRFDGEIELYQSGGDHGALQAKARRIKLDEADGALDSHYLDRLREDIELLDLAGDEWNVEAVSNGELSPMFFGSAMNNFGVQAFLELFLQLAPPPAPREDVSGPVQPTQPFSGFIFKIQAKMNPAHRDRIAFMRICSGRFEKGMEARSHLGGKPIRLAQPQQFMADSREMIEEAYAGDIIGLFDPGLFHLGETLSQSGKICYEGIPLFAPEYFARVSAMDSMKRKAFSRGMTELAEEGAVQLFRPPDSGREEWIAGVVGMLQLDVLKYRLQGEYGVEARMESMPVHYARWIVSGKADRLPSDASRAFDGQGRAVLLFEHEWSIRRAMEYNPGLELTDIAPRERV